MNIFLSETGDSHIIHPNLAEVLWFLSFINFIVMSSLHKVEFTLFTSFSDKSQPVT